MATPALDTEVAKGEGGVDGKFCMMPRRIELASIAIDTASVPTNSLSGLSPRRLARFAIFTIIQ